MIGRSEVWHPWSRWVGAFVAMLMLAVAVATPAQPEVDSGEMEQRVKAAFLYKFTEYVDWPDDSFAGAEAPITIAVLRGDPVASELNRLVAGRSVGGRTLIVRTIQATDELAAVQVLFIGRDANADIARIVERTLPRSILIVTESDRALPIGSVINFVISDGRVRFEISTTNAERRSLKLSSRLLAVAQNLRPDAAR